MMNRPGAGPDAGADLRLRTMRILWLAFLVNVGLFVLVCRVAGPDGGGAAGGGRPFPTLLLMLFAMGLASVAASFVVKPGFYRRAAERGAPAQMQTGLIIALALCEAAALLGVVGVFVTQSDYAYALFGLGALGQALHFPRREQVLSAYYRPGVPGRAGL